MLMEKEKTRLREDQVKGERKNTKGYGVVKEEMSY